MARALRGDIQGLRAVAVLTVIAAHFGLPHLQGGFVGVDVFFVISGYLITDLLLREVARDGTLSLTGFYARRARRILPAATVVTLATVAASLLWLSLIDARQVLEDSIWATFFAANIHFAATGVDYFAQEQGPSPLQHYWSLSVEEQFYLVWPLLLLGCVLWARRRGGVRRRTVAAVLGALTIASLVASVVLTSTTPVSAYFSTFTRAWELGVGALAAVVAPTVVRVLTPRARAAAAYSGLAAIAVACLLFTAATPFPGYAAVLPVVGSGLLLVAGAGGPTPRVSRALAVRPLRVIGDWSYSLYLWHWPVLVVAERHLGRSLRVWETLAVAALVFALSAATYRWVETPFRAGPTRTRWSVPLTVPRAMALYPASVALVLVGCFGGSYYTQWRGGELGHHPAITTTDFGVEHEEHYDLDDDPVVALVQASAIAARHHVPVPSDLTPDLLRLRESVADVSDCEYSDDVRRLCPHGVTGSDRSLVLVGDSHARAWVPAFEKIADRAGYTTYYLVKPQCNAAHVVVASAGEGLPWDACTDFQDWVVDQIDELEPDLVVVATSPPVNGVYVGGTHVEDTETLAAALRTGYDDLFADLTGRSDRVALIRDVPKSRQDPATCLTTDQPDLGDCMFRPQARSRLLGDVAVESAGAHGVEVVDPLPWLCWEGTCPAVIGSTLSYRDRGHLSVEYVETLAEPLGRALGLPWD